MPVLVVPGSVYPQGRVLPVMLKGIPPGQEIVDLPTEVLHATPEGALPVLIGSGMARLGKLAQGDRFVIRWRDAYGSYGAQDAEVVAIMEVENFKVDMGQVWLPLETLRRMAAMPGEASYLVISTDQTLAADGGGWTPRDHDFLLQDIINAVEADQASAMILYGILLALAALGIFNGQVLSIFRRRREIGTLMALGMTRSRVVGLFTLEGALHSVLAVALTAVWGLPLLYLVATRGIPIPYDAETIGIVMGKRMFPVYSAALFGGTVVVVALVVTVVSYLPSRRIAKMEPTEALRGRVT